MQNDEFSERDQVNDSDRAVTPTPSLEANNQNRPASHSGSVPGFKKTACCAMNCTGLSATFLLL